MEKIQEGKDINLRQNLKNARIDNVAASYRRKNLVFTLSGISYNYVHYRYCKYENQEYSNLVLAYCMYILLNFKFS